jgi:tetratricopeptide (TPR) repeat protein
VQLGDVRRPFVALLVTSFLLASTATPAAAPKPTFSALRERGRRAYRAQRFAEARDLFRAAAAMRPDDPDVVVDLALSLQHLGDSEAAIAANRTAIRLASTTKDGKPERARRARRAAYFNLGKLKAGRKLEPDPAEKEDLTCLALSSEAGCATSLAACVGSGVGGGNHWHQEFTAARFAPSRAVARTVEDDDTFHAFRLDYPGIGADPEHTHDQADAPYYDVTLSYYGANRRPAPDEADIDVSQEESTCTVVHVDACARRLGLYCTWGSWEEGVTAKPKAAAIELTFTAEDDAPPS